MKHRLILSRHRLQLAADLRVSAARPPPPRGQGRRKLRRAEERALSEGVARLGREEASLQANLLRRGPWRSALQMPMQYQPRLTAAPWHTVEAWRGERVAGGAQGGGRAHLRPLLRSGRCRRCQTAGPAANPASGLAAAAQPARSSAAVGASSLCCPG